MKGKTEPFVKLTRELIAGDAWCGLSINARRLIDFLMLEHMQHAGQRNGFLLAPRRHLEAFGIGARHISRAIEEAESAGLVDCKRGVGQRPSVYSLTWLPLSDGATPATLSEPSNRWRLATADGKSQRMTSEGKSQGYPNGSHKPRSDFRREVTTPQNRGIRREAPYKKGSYQGGAAVSILEGGIELAPEAICAWYVTNGTGSRQCGKAAVAGSERCAEHG